MRRSALRASRAFAAFLARSRRCFAVMFLAAFFPPRLPCSLKYSNASGRSLVLRKSKADLWAGRSRPEMGCCAARVQSTLAAPTDSLIPLGALSAAAYVS
jgi:hypothetical protein